ncbi:uncharacterized protein znf518b [Rhinoraja longicauda]
MQFKWLRVLLPKMERPPQKESFASFISDASMKCGTGRKQTARKALVMKNPLDLAQQKTKQNPGINKMRIEMCDHGEGYGKEITEMLMFCVNCKDAQKFSFRELKEHCQQKHPEDKPMFVCSRCGFTVDDVEQMNVHAIAHNIDSPLNGEPRDGKEDQSSGVRKLHKTRHLKKGTLYCNKCRFSTKDPLQFQKHILRHDEIQYKCGRCDHVCYTRGEFQRHSVQHTGTFPFKCRYCDYGAVRKDYVVKHTKGVHRDIVKNGGSVLVLPMRKGHKKAFPKPVVNGLKCKQTANAQNDNSANIIMNDQISDSINLARNPNEMSCHFQDLDIDVLPQTDSTGPGESQIWEETTEHAKQLNCFPTDTRKIRLQVLASSKHSVQPGTPLTLVAPAQVVIPSNCLAQLIEIKTVNGKQQLVFKLIPQASAAACPIVSSDASGMAALLSQETQQDMNTEIANPQKNSMSNNSSSFHTKTVDCNLFSQFDPLSEGFNADQNIRGINTKTIFSNSQSLGDTRRSCSTLEIRNKSSPKWKQKVTADHLQSRQLISIDSAWNLQQNGFVSPNILNKAVPCLQQGVLDSKTPTTNLSLVTQGIINQFDNESLTFSGSKEVQKNKNLYLTNEEQESNSNGERPSISRFNNKSLNYNEEAITINKTFGKPFAQLPKVASACVGDYQLLGSGRKTAIRSAESLPVDGTKTNLCITPCSTSRDTDMRTPLQISSTSCRHVTTSFSKDCSHQVTPNFPPLQSSFVSKDTNHPGYLKNQRTGITNKQLTNFEACKSRSEHESMCFTAAQNPRNISDSCLRGYDEVPHIVNSFSTVRTCVKSRKTSNLPLQQLNVLEHREINENNNIKLEHNLMLDTKIRTDVQENTNCPLLTGTAVNLLSTKSTGSLANVSKMHDNNELVKEGFLYLKPDAQYARGTLQDVAVNSDCGDFSNQCVEGIMSAENHLVDMQWPVISSVFSLSCGTNGVPENILWDNDRDNICPSFATEQILKPNPCSLIQTDNMSLSNNFEERKSNKGCYISESLSHKNPEHTSKSGNGSLSPTAVQSVVSGSPFKLSRNTNLAECPSLLPPVSLTKIADSSSAQRFKQFDDDVHVFQDADDLCSEEFSLSKSSSNVCLDQSPSTGNNTAVEHSTHAHNFVQVKQLNTNSDSTENSLNGVGPNHRTKPVVPPNQNVPNLSPYDVSVQNKSLPIIQSLGVDGLAKTSVSHNISSSFLLSPSPSGVTTNAFKEQVQNHVGLKKNCEPNVISSKRDSFHQNICHFSEGLQKDLPITSTMSSVKLCHQLSLENKDSLFTSSCNSNANSKNVHSGHDAEIFEHVSHSLGETLQFTEKLTLPPATKIPSISLSTSLATDNQSNPTKVQLKPPSNISSILSMSSSSFNQGQCFPRQGDASNQTKCVVNSVNSQNSDEIKTNKPNCPWNIGTGSVSRGQKILNPLSQLESTSEVSSLCTAFPICSVKAPVNPESTLPPHHYIKDTDCSQHETTYKVVSSGIVLRVLGAADDSKQKESMLGCQSGNQSQNFSVFYSSTFSDSTATKSEMHAPLVAKIQKELGSINKSSSKTKYQATVSCKLSSVLVDQPNTCDATSFKSLARQKSRQVKCSEELPLKQRCTRKGKADQVQHNTLLKLIEKQDHLASVATDICEQLKTARKLRLKPFDDSQLVKCPRRNQPVVVLNHPDVDVQEVTNVMQTIGKYRGHVLKVVLSERTVISLNLKKKQQRQEIGNQSILRDKWHNCKVVSPVKERLMLKMKLKKIHKNNYQIVKSIQNEQLQFKFHCWFCGRMFCDQEEWIAHGQRHLMEATRDWNDVTNFQETTENGAEVLKRISKDM